MGAKQDNSSSSKHGRKRSRGGGGDDARLPFGGKRRLYDVIKVRLPGSVKTVECDASRVYVDDGTRVVVKTRRGMVLAKTVGTRYRKILPTDTLQPILRAATERDEARDAENAVLAREALFEAVAESRACRLDMKFISAELMLDRRRLVLYFSAEGRVDFRQLVRRLSRKLRARIEMHQVGVRNGAGMLGGVGSCGRELCCSTFLTDFEPVAIRMVKDQGLTLNPRKVSGMCGRLMCCLVYEHSGYVRGRKRLPRRRATVRTRHGLGQVRNIDIVQETVLVRHDDGTEDNYPLIEVMLDPARDAADGPSEPLVFTIDGIVSSDDDDAPRPPEVAEHATPSRGRGRGRGRSKNRGERSQGGRARPPAQQAQPAPDGAAAETASSDETQPRRRRRRRGGRSKNRGGGSEGSEGSAAQSAPSDNAPSGEANSDASTGTRRRRRRRGRSKNRDGGNTNNSGGGGGES